MNKAEFWARVTIRSSHECWLWVGGRAGAYGTATWNGRKQGAHRIAWEISNKSRIPRGLHILHSCDVPLCVNPEHLSVGTHLENVMDMIRKERGGKPPHPKGEDHPRARLGLADVTEIRISSEPTAALAARYRVSKEHIRRIRRRDAWGHTPSKTPQPTALPNRQFAKAKEQS